MKNPWIQNIYGPVIQGEGKSNGLPTIFVRTGGCDYRCSWCDTDYAVLAQYKSEWQKTPTNKIVDKILQLSNHNPLMVTLSGGNPAIQPLGELTKKLKELKYPICIETQGTRSPEWFSDLDEIVLSPKPPSSLMRTNFELLENIISLYSDRVVLKVVVMNNEELDWQHFIKCKLLAEKYKVFEVYVQLGTDQSIKCHEQLQKKLIADYKLLSDELLKRSLYNVKISFQVHTLINGFGRDI